MPGTLVEATATVQCPHGGKVTPSRTSTRVFLSNVPATMVGVPWNAACPAQPPAATPCSVVPFAPGALRVLVEGLPAILNNTPGQCAPNGPASVIMTQQRVTGQ
jgi:hypothetical protein